MYEMQALRRLGCAVKAAQFVAGMLTATIALCLWAYWGDWR